MTPTPEESLAAEIEVVEAETDLVEALHARDVELLSADLELLEIENEVLERRADRSSGMVPEDATRARFPHEIAARVNYAAMDTERKDVEQAISRVLVDVRARFLELLAADLGDRTDAEIIKRLAALDGPVGYIGVIGARELVRDTSRKLRAALLDLAKVSAERVRAEADAQGVPKAGRPRVNLDAAKRAEIDRQAERLAQGPIVDLVRNLRERAYVLGAGAGTGKPAGRDLSGGQAT